MIPSLLGVPALRYSERSLPVPFVIVTCLLPVNDHDRHPSSSSSAQVQKIICTRILLFKCLASPAGDPTGSISCPRKLFLRQKDTLSPMLVDAPHSQCWTSLTILSPLSCTGHISFVLHFVAGSNFRSNSCFTHMMHDDQPATSVTSRPPDR